MGTGDVSQMPDGVPPSTAFNVAPLKIAVDQLDQLYWVDYGLTGTGTDVVIRRINKITGFVENFVGRGGVSYAPTGTHRLDVQIFDPKSLAFDSQNRLIFTEVVWNVGLGKGSSIVYRVNLDDTLEIIAGSYSSTASPIDGTDARARSLGYDSVTEQNGYVTVKKGTPDVLYAYNISNKNLYSIDLSTYVINRVWTDTGGNTLDMAFDYSRNTVNVIGTAGIYAVRTDVQDTVLVTYSTANGEYGSRIAMDSSSGIYYTTIYGKNVFYYSTAGVSSTFAGVSTGAGNGGLATLAELRSPSQLSVDPSNNVYLLDSGNNTVRNVNTSGIINLNGSYYSPGPYWGNLTIRNTTTPTTSTPIVSSYWTYSIINGLIGPTSCIFLCYGSSNNLYTVANGSTATDLEAGSAYANLMAYNSSRNSTFVEAQDQGTATGFLVEIDNAGNVYRRSGLAGTYSVPTVGTPVSSSTFQSGYPNVAPFHFLQTLGNNVYKQFSDNQVYRFPIGGNVALESPVGVTVDSYYVDGPPASKFYWTVGSTLYSQPLGGGTTTTIATFPYPLILQAKAPLTANTLLFTYGNFVYQYTNAGQIP